MLYCINNLKKGRNNAGSKAPADVYEIAKEYGALEIKFYEPKLRKKVFLTRITALPVGIQNWNRLNKKVKAGDWVLLQHPNENLVVANYYIDIVKRKNVHFIALIHDLDSLRKSLTINDKRLQKRNFKADTLLLKKCDYIICHNEYMKKYLLEQGFDKNRIVCLEIFDYLHKSKLIKTKSKEKSVAIAGNLIEGKCGYLYKLCTRNNLPFFIHLFGPNYEGPVKKSFLMYHGACNPDELPEKLEGSFGLVWDGTEIDKCAGNAGEYIKYNNPHKCSLFLASNMPVIIWKHAALAEFVVKNGVGITIDSLLEIGEAIDKISNQEYEKMVENTKKIGEKLRDGHYLKSALTQIKME
ncbi:hypothetical protein [Blautia wexlerae]|uniref:hypothetical protein n=1 Tax=Blautia wexlerae TaxID=418240 RepID=UPI0032C07D65